MSGLAPSHFKKVVILVYCYFQNEALKSEEGCIPNVAPDICIAYKLHLECSRLINLVDWSEVGGEKRASSVFGNLPGCLYIFGTLKLMFF